MSPTFCAEVVVMPKPEVADPQGQAIEQALSRLAIVGADGVSASKIHVGKVFRLELEAADEETASNTVATLADRVLANPNIETFTYRVDPVS